jgi:ribosome-associated translation inhibitor RaiA
MSKLQLLTTKFENLKMDEYETILEFNARLRDIENTYFALGEKTSEEKPARKILRSLPKGFDMKVTTIEEAQDLSSIKVYELIGSLQTFNMSICDKLEKKNKSMDFISEENHEDNLSDAISFIGRKFNKSLNKLQTRWKTNDPDKTSNNSRNKDVSDKLYNIISQDKNKEEEKSDQDKEVGCPECEGHGHYNTECHNYLKRQKKGLTIVCSD